MKDTMQLKKINYNKLSARQKENYNFHKISAVLTEYGFVSIRLSDDWQGADFIAQHFNGSIFLKVQLKGRATIDKKYLGKDLYIGFPYKNHWYLYPHDEAAKYLVDITNIGNTTSWKKQGAYSFGIISKANMKYFSKYKL